MKRPSLHILGICVLLFFAGTSSLAQDNQAPSFTLTIALQNRHNPDFRICMPISAENPIELTWKEGGVKNELSASMVESEDKKYPVKFTHKQSTSEGLVFSMMIEPKLTLDKSTSSIFVASSVFKNYHLHSLLLSRETCNRKTDFERKP